MMKCNRLVQCDKCPWKVTTDPHDIPDGYSVKKHQALRRTISESPLSTLFQDRLVVMGCHEHSDDEQVACVGWLHNQLGPGNNIALRLALSGNPRVGDLRTVGEQHPCFEDTLP